MATGVATLAVLVGCSGDSFEITPIYNHANGRVVVQMNRDIDSSETLFVQARRGNFGTLDCTQLSKQIAPVEGATGDNIDGPLVDPKLTKPFYGPEWGQGAPTAEMLASLANGTDSIIDVCLMDGDKVVAQIERDLFQAWDAGRKQGLGGKADDPSGEVQINSPQEYGVRCVSELGEIPFFEKTGDQEYTTYDCLESTPIPMTVTQADGTVLAPTEGTQPKCDAPQFIYSLCEAGPRVATRTNDKGTRWTLLCRKSIGGYTSNQYNDIAMIGHNPFTGKTCFFQNALYSKIDGGHIPHPADKTKSQNLWSGVHGGVGSGIQCGRCHDADPFIHSPWIDGAKDQAGRPVVPKMGIDPDLAIGALDTPYAIVNRKGQHWTMPKQMVSPEANACLKCHRMGDGQWASGYLQRLEGTDASWTGITTDAYNQPIHKYWMPTDVSFTSDAQWTGSEFAKALDFIQKCAGNSSADGCMWRDVPETLGEGGGGGKIRNPVNLPDDELAKQATTLLGMNKNVPGNNVCSECHAPNQTTLREWQEKTATALGTCLASTEGGEPRQDKQTDVSIDKDELKVYGPYEVAAGATISVRMTGTGDADLYVKRGEEVTREVYDCRPYTGSANENCLPENFNATGPAKFWVGVNGYTAAKFSLTVDYKAPGNVQKPAAEIVDCFRMEPGHNDSPYSPGKLGIFAAGAHLGYFTDLFKSAFPAGEHGNDADTWALEYGKFKSRASMPKGNHPRFAQSDFDIIAEWFVRGLPRLTTYIAPDTGPTSCTPNISSAVGTHASAMATQGWKAVNAAAGMNMFDLSHSPDASTKSYGSTWAAIGQIKVTKELSFNTFFWMRSSPDGRFVSNGSTGGDGAVISDLQTGKDIKVQAAYDPGYYPDGRAWVFMGTPIGAGVCSTSLLQANPDRINFSEPQCHSLENVGLYQHLAAGLGGGDYFAINSQFTSDNPSGAVTRDPSAGFAQSAQIKITPMVFNGTTYTGKPSVSTNSPYEGDSVLSPSSKLVISRFGNEGQQLGYVLRRVNATPNGGSYDITTTEIARYCVQGAKPAISFDERFFVSHHYVTPNDFADLGYASANDPAFQEILSKGASNIVLVDMVTGQRKRITTMKAGQYALYPHFRSDNWIYFQVRDKNTNKEYTLASNAALL